MGRQDLEVDVNGNWRHYTKVLPYDSTPLGVVTRNGAERGALIRLNSTGLYVQMNAGVMRGLELRKVTEALLAIESEKEKFALYTVNSFGLQLIESFLRENHKKFCNPNDKFIPESMLRAWAHDAEFQLSEGNPASIEIRSSDCVHGRTMTFAIPDEGLDVEIREFDD